MQTSYFSTTHFIRHEGNLVDLAEFRRKLALSQSGSLAPKLQAVCTPAVEEKASLTLLPPSHRYAPKRRERAAWILDACASLAIIIMTAAFAFQVLP